MAVFGWSVLTLVFVDELLAMAALGVWGWQEAPAPWLMVWLLPLLAVAAWSLLASPRARYGGPVVRPVTKALVFGLASLALWDADHATAAVGLLLLSVIVNGLAAVPAVAGLAEASPEH